MFLKDPDAILEYRVDWNDALVLGVSIMASEWRVKPVEEGGIAIVSTSREDGFGKVVLNGGLPGHVYEVGNLVTMSDGTVDERTVVIRVENR